MRFLLKQAALIVSTAVLATGSTKAAILVTSDFTGTISGDTNTLDVTWTGLEASAASDLSAIYPSGHSGFGRPGGSFGSDGTAYIDTNLNISPTADPRGYSFTLTPSSAYDLSSLQVRVAHATSSGGFQTFTSDLTVSITEGVDTVFTNTQTVTYDGNWKLETYDLTGKSLAASTAYTVTITMNNLVGGGAYFTSDYVTLTAVPEPSSLALLAGGLAGGLPYCAADADHHSPQPKLQQ